MTQTAVVFRPVVCS